MSAMHHRRAGYPFGTVVEFAADGAGHPIFCLSPLAIHTRNLVEDPRASLVMHLPGWTGLANARVTIFGDIVRLPDELQAEARAIFQEKHQRRREGAASRGGANARAGGAQGIEDALAAEAAEAAAHAAAGADAEGAAAEAPVEGAASIALAGEPPVRRDSTAPHALGRATAGNQGTASDSSAGTAGSASSANASSSSSSSLSTAPRNWVAGNASFFRMENIRDVYFVGGFGTVQWVSASEYAAAVPDTIVLDDLRGTVLAANESFRAKLRAALGARPEHFLDVLRRAQAGLPREPASFPPADDAVVISVDRLGADVRVRRDGESAVERLRFAAPVETREQALESIGETLEAKLRVLHLQ